MHSVARPIQIPSTQLDSPAVSGHMVPPAAASASGSEADEPPRMAKFLCSFGGSILPRPLDGRLRYVGGDTRIVMLPRDISYSDLLTRMRELFEGVDVIKYQQPDEDLDALVSVVSDDDVMNMMEEYDKLIAAGEGFTRLRIFLFSQHLDGDVASVAAHYNGDEWDTERRYVDALNNLGDVKTPTSPVSVEQLFGIGGSESGFPNNIGLRHLNVPRPSYSQRYGEMDSPWSPAYVSPGHYGVHDPREFPISPSSARFQIGAEDFDERIPDDFVRYSPKYRHYENHSPPHVDNLVWLPPGAVIQEKAGFPGNLSHPNSSFGGNHICEHCHSPFQKGQSPITDARPFLFQCSQSSQEDHREVALILFSSLTETIGTTFQSHLTDLQPILLKCLQDETSSRVRISALKAVGAFIEFVNDGGDIVKMFRDFVPSILNVSRQCLANGEEDVASIAFEIFDELIESPAPLLGDSVRSIVQFSLEVCSSQDLEINIRHQAIQIISWLVKFKASFLKKHNLVVPILQVMCPLLTEMSDEDEDSDLAADRAAAEVIDTMAINLPRHVFAPVFEFASVSFRHVNPKYREAAVTSLGVVSEGCCERVKDKLEACLKIVLEALKDPEQMVRGAASFALGQFAEHLQPEILSHYETVLQCILNALEDPSDEVKEKSYYALAAFCEDMGEDILPYLDPLISRLVMSLQSSPRNLQETCMSAIGSVATAAEQAFIPYAEKVLEMMKGFMVLASDEDLCARARATEVVGIVAMAVGRARMEPILHSFVEAALSGFGLDYSELREYTHGFFSNIAEILDDGFAKYLPHVVPLVFSSCNLDDGSAVDIDDTDSVDNGFGGVSSDDDVNDEPRVRNISVRTGVLDEKAAATQAIGFFALHTKSAYAPYLEESLKILVRHSGYFHEDVRLQAIISLKHILTAVRTIPSEHADVVEKQKEVLDTVMNIYIKTMTEDDDKEVVAQACMSVADIVRDSGFTAIESYMPQLAEATLVLLRQESCCQQVESNGEADDGDVDHDEVLMDAVSDLLPVFAKVMGSYFDPIFGKLFDPLMKFAKAPHPPQDKTMVVATLAEVAQGMGAPISAYVDRIMPLVLKELASSEATNRRNAAFCAGEICKNGGPAALKYYGDILRALYPLFGNSEPDNAVRDNAAGAIARMIMVQPQSVPLNQVLPVFIKALPLKEDHEESMVVYSCICNLLLSSHPQILPLVPDVIHIFAQVVVSPDESDEVKINIGKATSHLISVYGQQMQPILSALPPAHANALAAFANKR